MAYCTKQFKDISKLDTSQPSHTKQRTIMNGFVRKEIGITSIPRGRC
uniref:Bm9742, isoform b n=1 Tax=Brugia malayi TaxID=6279 RepID=A0A1I9G241_BRUMA|nr:Bm9742, isoform b [Brugia malayi]